MFSMNNQLSIRHAEEKDLTSILSIYNQGIEDRIATLETDAKDSAFINQWFQNHGERFPILVAESNGNLVGWGSLNPFNPRKAYDGVADLSIYIERESRGKGIGNALLKAIENEAIQHQFHKIVLSTFPFNLLGQSLYERLGYREVGTYKNQGIIDGKYVDVMIMEKLLASKDR